MIVGVAIKNPYGEVFFMSKPARHDSLIKWLVDHNEYTWAKFGVQGFVTDKCQFMDRRDAYHYAIGCGQYQRKLGSTVEQLFSEDLW